MSVEIGEQAIKNDPILLIGHKGPVYSCSFESKFLNSLILFLENGIYALSGGHDCILRLWNPHRLEEGSKRKGLLIKEYKKINTREITDIISSNDNSFFISCGKDKVSFVVGIKSGHIIRKFYGHRRDLTCVDIHNSGSFIATGSTDTNINLYDLKSKKSQPTMTLSEAKDVITNIAITSNEVICSVLDGNLLKYDIRNSSKTIAKISLPKESSNLSYTFNNMTITKDSSCIAVDLSIKKRNSIRKAVLLAEKNSFQVINFYSGKLSSDEDKYKGGLCLSFDEKQILQGGKDLTCWDFMSAQELSIKGNEDSSYISTLNASPNTNSIVQGCHNGNIYYTKY